MSCLLSSSALFKIRLVYGVSLHESVRLTCEVDADPLPVSFNWRFQGNSDLTSFKQINDSRSVLTPVTVCC